MWLNVVGDIPVKFKVFQIVCVFKYLAWFDLFNKIILVVISVTSRLFNGKLSFIHPDIPVQYRKSLSHDTCREPVEHMTPY